MYDFNDAQPQTPPDSKPQADPISAFSSTMARAGFNPGVLVPDGKLQRFDIDKRGDKAGWYWLALDGCPAGAFGSWKTSESHKWSLINKDEMTPAQIADVTRQFKRAKEEREKEKARINEAARIRAALTWDQARPAPDDHPYLKAKNIASYDLKTLNTGQLVIPMFDSAGVLWSLQFINPDGSKKFIKGGAIKGNYFTIPGNDNIYICEGYATGATIREATGGTVFVAFNSGNLKRVAKNVKSKHPAQSITICADNDQWTEGNPGVKAANRAAAEIGARVVIPTFKDTTYKPTDFNDLARMEGNGAVIKHMSLKRRIETIDVWKVKKFTDGDAEPYNWLVKDTFPLEAVSLLAAAGDTGKGMLSTHLGLCIAQGPTNNKIGTYHQAFGNDVLQHGNAVIFTAEDTMKEVHRRCEQIDPARVRLKTPKDLYIVPLPNAGGVAPLVKAVKGEPEPTDFYHEIKEHLAPIKELKLIVFDPMASFIAADINADPMVGAFTTGLLSSLAVETGAAVLVIHHMGKGQFNVPVNSAEKARHLIRGTTAIVDGVRAAYALWVADPNKAKRVCDGLKLPREPNTIFSGALVKSNGPGDRVVKTYVRDKSGLLIDRTSELSKIALDLADVKQILVDDIQRLAYSGQPFTIKGAQDGIVYRRAELSNEIRVKPGRDALIRCIHEMIEDGVIKLCVHTGKTRYLDVPGGPFDTGTGEIRRGGNE